ncbi:Flagellar assembly protein FliH/Type III secretion system HrpE [Desulfonatronospira thiodismutans ASO3-1]|uniref:Flagellar assembly protein FliH n=1 Tax=Desulfonatronospira thiodismutans ASO3-1 TaxID=555779 RepID=D6STA3_9BACT|nr:MULTISPECIES: FliH/SctL family protein [Desulfonatronospira]EFI33919.1 Flagellar assembly protein FliH/Type III secretion system HrpE [Desulfonatronospira thiodismutans ASO3-1]RQD72977.1 MAG: hypothetical protein D5S03_13755 [Desulfonatronospira sp. MSAO_Bac3]
MSLSDNTGKARMGRVIFGLQSRGLEEMDREAESAARTITPDQEQEFLGRVKEKAREKASEILNQAMQEASQMREDSVKQGYEEGLKNAKAEIEKQKKDLAQKFEKFLSQMHKEKKDICERHRENLVMVMQAGLEKVVGQKIDDDYARVMESLLREALEQMEQSRELTIKVHENDQELIKNLLAKAGDEHPELGKCKVRASRKIQKGGLVLESGQGMVDNTLDSRYSKVREVVDKISLKEDGS